MIEQELKLGKLEATVDHRDLLFGEYLIKHQLPPMPAEFGWEHMVGDWGMLGNDNAGDCVFAGADHETMLWNAAAGHPVEFSEQTALDDYGDVTGYNPETGENDNGTYTREAMKFRQEIGVVDVAGNRHKIGAYVALEPGNWEQMREALFIFGVVGIGIEFPDTAMSQFNRGKAWHVQHGATIEGGHYIPLVGFRHSDPICVTWGRLQKMSKHFYQKYCDEAWAMLSDEMLTDGKSIGGFDLATLQADLAALKGA